jgi:ferritin
MESLHDTMFEHLEDEIEDACEYLKKSEEAEDMDKPYLATGLRKMAMDEYTHARFLREYLIKKEIYHVHEHHNEVEAHWHRLREKLGYE